MPLWPWPPGLLLLASGFAILAWAMGVGPFFEGTVRIQIVLRTALEELALRRELPGYADFAWRVRLRLFPGVW